MYFSKGNRKLSKDVLIWNLPRLTTCPGASSCKDWCYEIKIERMYKGARPCRKRNFQFSKQSDFVRKIVAYLVKRREPYVRIHESGDFYSQKYLDKWKEIARQCLNKKFYVYTKSFHLDLWSNLPNNFHIIQSYGSKWDRRIDPNRSTNRAILKGVAFAKREYLCPFNEIRDGGCGSKCVICMEKRDIHIVGYIH